ncbi:hypothetical protein [Kitasatospora sp. NPDC088134]|uniref:hypothetical protein n=1 Tax=Kitasatospora sp. NPDC088134 TaxID=3364071 RepID=UPI0038175D0D
MRLPERSLLVPLLAGPVDHILEPVRNYLGKGPPLIFLAIILAIFFIFYFPFHGVFRKRDGRGLRRNGFGPEERFGRQRPRNFRNFRDVIAAGLGNVRVAGNPPLRGPGLRPWRRKGEHPPLHVVVAGQLAPFQEVT